MADFSSMINANVNVVLNGLSRHDRKKLSRKMRRAEKRLKRRARRTPEPCNALAVECHHHH